MEPRVSVVIPTYNRVELLKETLGSLINQSLSQERFEIIVVDDGSEDGTPQMLEAFRARTLHSLSFYRQEHRLAGSARNLGVQRSTGDIILFMDDDIVPNPDLVRQHYDLHLKYPEIEVAVLGRFITGDTGVDLCRPDNRKHFTVYETSRGDPVVHPTHFATANVSMKKAFFIRGGQFDPRLPCEQDLEFALRLKGLGLKLIYCPEATGIHLRPLDTIEKVVNSGKRNGRVLAEWYDRIPSFQRGISSVGARLDGGWNHLKGDPWGYIKDAIRRWTINKHTIGLISNTASILPITNPPSPLLVRLCKEIWSFHYRHEFRRVRLQLGETQTPRP